MRFFFPDSLDMVDPSFDFETETRSPSRIRQRDDIYAHEVFARPPYDGLLVSKAIVDGTAVSNGRYTLAQRHRLLREGVRQFFRLDARVELSHIETMGDCGAFSYVKEDQPPYTVEDVLQFYETCGFDYGVSVDHVILGYDAMADGPLLVDEAISRDWARRQELTLELAYDFVRLHRSASCRFVPIGVAQGWSPASYKHAVASLQKMGYSKIALGGMVPLKTQDIVACLERVEEARQAGTSLHLFGVTRTHSVSRFADYGVESFDSTSPLRQAFKDEKDNYYTATRTYSAIRVPQVEGNPKLQGRIAAGEINQDLALRLERECLRSLIEYDRGGADLETVLTSLAAYSDLHGIGPQQLERERSVLEDQPWKTCPCEVCKEIGIHVVLFRGAERNRRRGFHNLHVFFFERLRQSINEPVLSTDGASD
ncbi:MAG: tRNA-guanine transglycosylase DpdA [Gemmatimonadales bacterium]